MSKRIAIAGKGGTGKSTIAAMIVSRLCALGAGPVLAIDADPDSNLGTLLGIEPEQTVGNLRDEFLKEIKDFPAGMSKANYVEAGLHQIIEESKGFDLITMGKGEGPGCYCYLNNLIRKFSDDLMQSYEWIVIDNEAGLEHISRRTSGDIDALVIVVTDNPISIRTAAKIEKILDSLENHVCSSYLVTNMVAEKRKDDIRQRIEGLNAKYLCDIPGDDRIEDCIFEGNPLSKITGSPVNDCIEMIIKEIGENNGNS